MILGLRQPVVCELGRGGPARDAPATAGPARPARPRKHPVPQRITLTELSALAARALADSGPAAASDVLRLHGRGVALEAGAGYRGFLTALPREVWERDPVLIGTLAASHRAPGERWGAAGLGYVETAESLIRSGADAAPAAAIAVALERAAALRGLGRFDEARAPLASARFLLTSTHIPDFVIRMRLDARTALEAGLHAFFDGDFEAARGDLDRALGLGDDHLVAADCMEALGAVAILDVANGRLSAVDGHLAAVESLAGESALARSRFAAPTRGAVAYRALEVGETRSADALFAVAAAAAGQSEWAPFALILEARMLAGRGRSVEALELLQQVERRTRAWGSATITRDMARLARVTILLQLQRGREARELLEHMPEHRGHVVCLGVARAQLALLGGDLAGAAGLLEACERRTDGHAPRALVDVRVLRAAIALELRDLAVADLCFDRALLSIARIGTRVPLRAIPRRVAEELLSRARSRPQPAEVAELLAGGSLLLAEGDADFEPLSERERIVVGRLVAGDTVAAIGRALYLSPNTVKTHVRNAYRKLGVTTRAEAVARIRGLGFTPESPAVDEPSEPER